MCLYFMTSQQIFYHFYCIQGGLEDLANFLQVERVGSAHQAGSDSLLTGDTFFALAKVFFIEIIVRNNFLNIFYRLFQPN